MPTIDPNDEFHQKMRELNRMEREMGILDDELNGTTPTKEDLRKAMSDDLMRLCIEDEQREMDEWAGREIDPDSNMDDQPWVSLDNLAI